MRSVTRAERRSNQSVGAPVLAPLIDMNLAFQYGTHPMTRTQQPALTLFAVGMIGLGILALVYGDFALVWQPVAPWIPGRTVLAYASGLIMLLGGVWLLFRGP